MQHSRTAIVVESLEPRRFFSVSAMETVSGTIDEMATPAMRTPRAPLAVTASGNGGNQGGTFKPYIPSSDPADPGLNGKKIDGGSHTSTSHTIKPGKGFFDAVMVGVSNDPRKVAPMLKDLGIKGVRLWGTLEWNHTGEPDVFERARQFNDLGFSVTMLLTTPKAPPSEAKAIEYFKWTLNQPKIKAAVDRWEIINEPNLKKYWAGTLKDYVTKVLKPAYNVYHAAGETVIGGGISEKVGDLQTLINNGYLKYCDVANIHPYGYKLQEQVDRINQAKKMVGSKPLTMTEWNFHGASMSSWAKMLEQVRPLVVKTMESTYYYRFMMSNSYAGPAGLVTTTYGKHNPFYSLMKQWNDDDE